MTDATPPSSTPAPGGPATSGVHVGAPAAPVAAGERIVALDVLRGLALFGILMVNIFTFGLPMQEAFMGNPGAPLMDRLAHAVMLGGFQMKFMPIFSMLFGAGLAVQVARSAARGDAFVPLYLRRVGVLLLIGLVHALLLWYGDILFWYAVLGTGLLFVRRTSSRRLLRAGAILIVIGGVIGGALMGLSLAGPALAEAQAKREAAATTDLEATEEVAAPTTNGAAAEAPPEEAEADATPPRGLDAMMAAKFDVNSALWQEAETVAYRDGPWIDAFAFRAVTWAFGIVFLFLGMAFVVFGCFLVGAGLLRAGFFDPSQAAAQGRLAARLLLLAVPLELIAAGLSLTDLLAARIAFGLVHGVSGPAMAVGLLAGITWLVSTGRSRAWDGPVRAAGRMALSVYLGETILATAIFYWWGLGQFGHFGPWALLGTGVGIWLLLVAAATLWLRVFRIGPAEWFWRTLTYGRWQPVRRAAADSGARPNSP